MKEDCSMKIECPNCWQHHLVYSRSSDIYKKEKEILEVKHKRNMTFLEARKIVGSYMGKNIYNSAAQKVNPIRQSD